MSKLIDYSDKFLQALSSVVKCLVPVVLGIGLMALLFVDFTSICDASRQLLARVPAIVAIELPGVKVSLTNDAVEETIKNIPDLDSRAKSEKPGQTWAVIQKLLPEEFARLMGVGQLDGLCEYEKPSAQMRADVALDYKLQEMGLTEIVENSQSTLDDVKRELKALEAKGKHLINGYPRTCYEMKQLTDLGRDVKTALVQLFKHKFEHSREPSEPVTTNREIAQR